MKSFTFAITIASTILLSSNTLPSIADIKTTTRTEGEPISLKSNISYILVDPNNGNIQETFDPDQVSLSTIPAGAIIVEKSSGRMVATMNPEGKTISILTAPAYDPLSAAIDNRRSELNHLINESLKDNKITESQARDLRERLDKVGRRQADDTSRGKMMNYSESVYLASELNDITKDYADISQTNNLTPLLGAHFIIKNNEVIMSR